MIREQLAEALKQAEAADEQARKSTLRLICTAMKDRDASARSSGKEALDENEIIDLLTQMVVQRHASAATYEQDGCLELAEQEREEIAVISEFLPAKLDEASMRAACEAVVSDVDARGLRDVGRCMSALKERYQGQIDPVEASRVVKGLLTGDAGRAPPR